MSRTIGAGDWGFIMVHPIFSICFAVCAGSIQTTALSQYVALQPDQGQGRIPGQVWSFAMGMSFLLAWVICRNAGFLAESFCWNQDAPYLPVMAVSVPFAALRLYQRVTTTACRSPCPRLFPGWRSRSIRMGAVFLIASIWLESGRQITVSLAVYGHLIGEMASAVFTVFCLGFFPPCKETGIPAAAPAIPFPSAPLRPPYKLWPFPLWETV